jgi:hypothetical protein
MESRSRQSLLDEFKRKIEPAQISQMLNAWESKSREYLMK